MTDREFWENTSEKFAEKFDRHTDYFGFECIEDLLGDVEGKRILDYGCGPGEFSYRLAKKGANVVGFDISRSAIEGAKRRFGDIGNLCFSDSREDILGVSYDACVSNFVFSCIGDSFELARIFRDIYFSLKDGGNFIFMLPNPDAIGRSFYSFSFKPLEPVQDGSKVEYFLRGMNEKFLDYFWSDDFFVKKILPEVGFGRIGLHKYIPGEDYKWIAERKIAPFSIYEGVKG